MKTIFRSTRVNVFEEAGYLIVKEIIRLWLLLVFKLRITGRENLLPAGKKIILAGNHSSLLDGLIVMAAYPQRVYFLATEALFKRYHFISWLAKKFGFIAVKKDRTNKEALKTAMSILRKRKPLVIFPEGQIVADGNIIQAKKGMAVLSKKSRAAVLPFAIEGAYEAWHVLEKFPGSFPVEIRFGKLVFPNKQNVPEELTEEVMKEIKRMKTEMEKEGYLRVPSAEIIRHLIYTG